jgi:hypothetical protein
MLEALISLRRTHGTGKVGGAEKADKKTGDIICVKKSPAKWGKAERKNMLVTYLNDPVLEAEFDMKIEDKAVKMRDALIAEMKGADPAEKFPARRKARMLKAIRKRLTAKLVWSCPYAVRNGNGEITKRSRMKVPINLFTGTDGLNAKKTPTAPTLPNDPEVDTRATAIVDAEIDAEKVEAAKAGIDYKCPAAKRNARIAATALLERKRCLETTDLNDTGAS